MVDMCMKLILDTLSLTKRAFIDNTCLSQASGMYSHALATVPGLAGGVPEMTHVNAS